MVAPRIVSPYIVGVAPYRPYSYGYRPGLTIGFYAGYGYHYPYYHYPYYHSPYYAYYAPYPSVYSYPSAYPGYASPQPYSVSAQPGSSYGGVRIVGAPKEAQVLVDGYYSGVVDDFDGAFQQLNLTAGLHHIEIRIPGEPQPVAFDVNVPPGQTITLRVQ